MGIKTWLSVEPVISYSFAEKIIQKYVNLTNYLRFGKMDNNTQNNDEWEKIAEKIKLNYPQTNVFVKKCK